MILLIVGCVLAVILLGVFVYGIRDDWLEWVKAFLDVCGIAVAISAPVLLIVLGLVQLGVIHE